MPDYSIKKAALINAASKYTVIFINMVFSAILARILTPEDYGIVAIIGVFITFFNVLSDVGLGTAVIQFKDLTGDDFNHLFTFSFYLAILLGGVFSILSIPVSVFYKNGVYIPVCVFLSISIVFNTLNVVPNSVLLRNKRFFTIAIRLTVVAVVSSVFTIMLALNNFKYYALVFQSIFISVFTWLWNFMSVRIKMVKKIKFDIILKIKNYSGFHFGFSFINYFARNLDKLIIGKMMGNVPLAQYDRAYKMMLYPVQNLTHVISPVLHPILSDYQNDQGYIYQKYIKVIKFLSLLGIFLTVACFWCSDEIILLVFGSQWTDAAKSFRWLSLSIWAQMVTSGIGAAFQSLGNTLLMFNAGLIAAIVIVLCIISGILIGGGDLSIVSMFISAAFYFSFLINYIILIKKAFGYSFCKFLSGFLGDILFIPAGLFFVFFADRYIAVESLFLSFLCKLLLIGVFYLAYLLLFYRRMLYDKFFYPLRVFLESAISFVYQFYYDKINKTEYGLNTHKRDFHIVVSLTSFPKRFNMLHYCLKSLLNQTLKPDRIILFLANEEIDDIKNLPKQVKELIPCGITVETVPDNIKPHKKYYYAMKNFPESIVITVDDDCFYNKKFVESMYKSYTKHPDSVSARRVHRMMIKDRRELSSYNEWEFEYKKIKKPSLELVAAGSAGVLYPPGIMPGATFDIELIKRLCLNADDIWMKFMEIMNGIPVVPVKNHWFNTIGVNNTQETALGKTNVRQNQNDIYIHNMERHFNIDFSGIINQS
jgi:PST family polysaccharide transporter